MDQRASQLRWRARMEKSAVKHFRPESLMGETDYGGSSSINQDDTINTSAEEQDALRDSAIPCGTTVMDILAVGAVISSILIIFLFNTTTTWLAEAASICTIFFGPFAAYQRRKLKALGSLRNLHNKLRTQTNQFHIQNEVLHRKLQRLDTSVSNLDAVQHELSLYTNDPLDLKRLDRIATTLNTIHADMRKCLQNTILSNILQIVVKADRNADFTLSGQELETLVIRCRSIKGVVFHESNFRAKMIGGECTLSTIMSLIRHVMADDDESNDIFTLKPQDLVREKRNGKRGELV